MAIELQRAGRGTGLLLVGLTLFISTVNLSLGQHDCYQFQAAMWVEGGTSFSDGDIITICFSIEMAPTSCDAGGIYACPSCFEHLVARVTIVDYPPNTAGSITLITQEYRLNVRDCIHGIVDCSSGSGSEMLVLYADITCMEQPITSVSTSCSFYVNCGEELTPTPEPTSPPVPSCYDNDRDGYTNCAGDCNDFDPAVHPGAIDICDEIDNNCNGEIDEDCQESTITLEVPEVGHVKEIAVISGILSPPRAADINLLFTKPDNTTFATSVTSTAEGAFSFSFAPESPGQWFVSASAEGSSTYRAAVSDSVPFTVEKITPNLSLNISSTLLYPREEIKISGTLSPPMVAYITIIIEDEAGHREEKIVSSHPDGTFSLFFRPDSVGKWSVSAKFDGDEKYENADSSTAFFTVTKEESAVSVSISTENEIIEGNSIEITGQIRPPRSATVLIYLENENGEKFRFQVLSKEDGTFSYFYTPQSAGMWSVYAHVPEAEYYTEVTSDIFSFSVEPAIPDLAVTDLMVNPSPVEPGEEVKIYFRVENLGTGAAEGVPIVVTARSDTDEKIIHEQHIPRVNAGSWTSIEVDWIVEYGVDTLFIHIDPSQDIHELSEENNSITHELDIVFTKDIAVTEVHFSPQEMEGGEPVTITATIRCEGEISYPLQIEFWDGKPEEGLEIATTMLSSFSEETFVEVQWTPQSGAHDIHVVADPANVIHEFDEKNNSLEDEVTVKEPFPVAETTVVVVTATSAGIYWYLKNTARSISRIVKRSPRIPHGSSEFVRHSGVSKALELARGYGRSSLPLSPAKDLLAGAGKSIAATEIGAKLYHAKDLLLRAGESTAATEIGAKLYKTLYNRYYHWNRAQTVDFERIVQHKQDLLQKVVTHLFIFEGYIDTEEFCRFFDVNESELLDILEFLHRNGYIEEVNS